MPDPNGLLLAEERTYIANTMHSKLKPAACPWCGESRWEVGPAIVVAPPMIPDGRISMVGPVVPMVSLISPCGHVAYFAAKMFGLQIRTADAPVAPLQAAPQET